MREIKKAELDASGRTTRIGDRSATCSLPIPRSEPPASRRIRLLPCDVGCFGFVGLSLFVYCNFRRNHLTCGPQIEKDKGEEANPRIAWPKHTAK